jgi:hypothetical protein
MSVGYSTIKDDPRCGEQSYSLIASIDAEEPDRKKVMPLHAKSSLVGGYERAQEFDAIRNNVRSFENLQNNWDLYSGKPADAKCIQYVLSILQLAETLSDLPPPQVDPISTGAFVDWRLNNGMRFYLEVDSDSVIFALYDGPNLVSSGEDRQYSQGTAFALILDVESRI